MPKIYLTPYSLITAFLSLMLFSLSIYVFSNRNVKNVLYFAAAVFLASLNAFFLFLINSSIDLYKPYFLFKTIVTSIQVFMNIVLILNIDNAFKKKEKIFTAVLALLAAVFISVFSVLYINKSNFAFNAEKGIFVISDAYLFNSLCYAVLYIMSVYAVFISIAKSYKKKIYKTSVFSSFCLFLYLIFLNMSYVSVSYRYILVSFLSNTFLLAYIGGVLYLFYILKNKYIKTKIRISFFALMFIYASVIFSVFFIMHGNKTDLLMLTYIEMRNIEHSICLEYFYILISILLSVYLIYLPFAAYLLKKRFLPFLSVKKNIEDKNNFDNIIKITAKDEFSYLAASYNNMIYNIRHNNMNEQESCDLIKDYDVLKKENISFEKELKAAFDTQKRMSSSLPKNANISFATIEKPFTTLSGDILDSAQIKDSIIRIFLASVPGCDVQAALISTVVKSEYENIKLENIGVSDIFKTLNEIIVEDHKETTIFFTGIILDIDFKEKSITYSSSQHPCQYIISGEKIIQMESTQNAVGISKNYHAVSKKIYIDKDSLLILFTRGLFEIYDKNDNYFGEEGIYKIIEENKNRRKEDIASVLLKKTNDYSKGARTSDVSIVVIEVAYNV